MNGHSTVKCICQTIELQNHRKLTAMEMKIHYVRGISCTAEILTAFLLALFWWAMIEEYDRRYDTLKTGILVC